ncbi:substrate-binding domain-containing protein [Cellulophaga lytica]|uniref:substrate-binding domain-containing protein n=1 Tax=Cellulophaga lytica TaxID=979 RepID=UPI000B5CCB00|nr:substrate-binding domain-containing protein [Cellulophaga lytica]SNQ43178.1 Two component transcriptional regulator, AraC family [Cellulophaga lytica]
MQYFKLTRLLLLLSIFTLIGQYSCTSTKENKKVVIGFSQTGINDQWRKSMNKSMQLQADFHPEIELKILDGNDNVKKQIEDITQLINDKVDVLIISPVQSKPITPLVNKALLQDIPVLIVDRKIDGQNYTSYIGGDNYQVGINAANYIAALSSNKEKKILEIKGLKGSSPAAERHLGFSSTINTIPNLKITHTIQGNWEANSIKETLNNLLSKNNNVDYIFCHNDRMALGAWEVLKQHNLEHKVDIIGVDGLNGPNGGIQYVKDGILKATVYYPTGGNEAIKYAIDIVQGKKINKNNILETTIIDSRNADIMKNQFDKINQHQENLLAQQNKIKEQEETYASQSSMLKVLLALFILSVLLGIFSIYSGFNISKKKHALELYNTKIIKQSLEIKEIAKEAELSNEAKANFFTGLSHEFKTPITLILSAIESITEKTNTNSNNLKTEITLISNNSKRLLRLINQLLDYRKTEEKKLTLKASKTNIFQFSTKIFNDFKIEAKKRGIAFDLKTNNTDLDLYIDRNLMDKVYFNLLSNALKFTPDNGEIIVSIEDYKNKNFVTVSFKDSGIGIPSDDIENIFKPFEIGSNNTKASSGIGLHLTKQFIELHKGEISVRSDQSTIFTIKLYKNNKHLLPNEIINEPDIYIDEEELTLTDEIEENIYQVTNVNNNDNKYDILIIEDNDELIKLLKNKLLESYKVHLSNGVDGVEKALDIIPDIIICDVNLPDKDGFVICEVLKNDLRTSHIPIIMLTALDNNESYIKGLKSGADSYLTKPFSFSVLSQSIKSLLYNREKLRYYYLNNVHKINPHEKFDAKDQEFILKINSIIEQNIDNSSFSVEAMAETLNISRVQLYRKIKAIIGVNISDYILDFRLSKAKNLLINSQLSISEIAYATGFSSPNYFSTNFKTKFNITPKEYRKDLTNNNINN